MLITTLLSLLFFTPIHVEAQVTVLSTSTINQLVVPYTKLLPALVSICTCESGQGTGKPQQFNIHTGEVLRGKINPKDTGACQINSYWNGATARTHGWDIYTLDGNIRMANWMYKNQGSTPWGWSSACWKKEQT
jgi:hypothetical protein